jgi:hypothetical protein
MKNKGKLSISASGKSDLLRSEPSERTIALGTTLAELSSALSSDPNVSGEYLQAAGDMEIHRKENLRFIDETEVNASSCPHSLKRWAAERLPQLNISYEVMNRLSPKDIEENADKRAAIRLIELAEDLLQISSFCRDLHGSQVEMAVHAVGMEFIVGFMGTCSRSEMRTIEDKGLNLLFEKYSRENSMRLRANVSDDYVEMQIIVLKGKLRLGLSPVD